MSKYTEVSRQQIGRPSHTQGDIVKVAALAGLGDFGAAGEYIRGQISDVGYERATMILAQQMGLGPHNARAGIRLALQPNARGRGSYSHQIAAALGAFGEAADGADITPASVATDTGAQQLAAAQKRAEIATQLHHKQAEQLEREIRKMIKVARASKDPGVQAQAQADAAAIARDLLSSRAQAARSAVVNGSVRAALLFRRRAMATRDPAARRRLLGQAAAAVDAGQRVAATKVEVRLPTLMSTDALDNLRSGGRPAGNPSGPSPKRLKLPSRAVPPPFPAPAGRVPTGYMGGPRGWPAQGALPEMPHRFRGMIQISDRAVAASLEGLDALGFDATAWQNVGAVTTGNTLISAASAPVKPSTDWWTGMINGVVDFAKNVLPVASTVMQALQGGQQQLTPEQLQVQQMIQQQTNASVPSGMSSPFGGLPGWILPVGVAGTIAALAFLL